MSLNLEIYIFSKSNIERDLILQGPDSSSRLIVNHPWSRFVVSRVYRMMKGQKLVLGTYLEKASKSEANNAKKVV